MRQEQRQREMRGESGETERMLGREARNAANRWLARFAPLLEERDTADAGECRSRLQILGELRAEGPATLSGLEARADPEDAPLAGTIEAALEQIDGLEADLKRRLGALAPGDPEGIVDIAALRAQLAEVAARRELGGLAGESAVVPARLEMKLSSGSWAAAGFMGIFSLGWLSFTTFHAFLMIGGMASAFGWGALALLGFYGIFWAVGIGMAWGAIQAASSEALALEGRELTLRRRLGALWSWERRHTLARDSRAYLTEATTSGSRRSGDASLPAREIAVVDAEGREVRFGRGCPPPQQEQLVARLNAYLNAS